MRARNKRALPAKRKGLPDFPRCCRGGPLGPPAEGYGKMMTSMMNHSTAVRMKPAHSVPFTVSNGFFMVVLLKGQRRPMAARIGVTPLAHVNPRHVGSGGHEAR